MKKKNRDYINNKKMFCLLIFIFITSIFLLVACGEKVVDMSNIETIEELSYDYVSEEDCIVYIEEDGAYVPYLVLTSDYGGNVLLLRKELMAETRPYKENESGFWAASDYASQYDESDIDKYLNNEFVELLGQSVSDVMVESNIVITDKASQLSTDRVSRIISRKVFLLSLEELVFNRAKTVTVKEGTPLKYFEGDYSKKVANMPDGSKGPYWTRTPSLWETYDVITIGYEAIGSGSADRSLGVRPAFCVEKSTPVVQSSGIVEGETVFVIN